MLQNEQKALMRPITPTHTIYISLSIYLFFRIAQHEHTHLTISFCIYIFLSLLQITCIVLWTTHVFAKI